MRTRFSSCVVAAAVVLAMATACGGGGGGTTTSADVEGTGELTGNGKELVFFTLATSNVYAQASVKGAQAKADELGYKLRVISPSVNDPSELTRLVQQYLASNPDPAAILWWPIDPDAGINDLRQLSRIAPVIQVDTPVSDGEWPYLKAFAGANQGAMGLASGELAIQAREDREAGGPALHSPNGNLLEFTFFTAFAGTKPRTDEFAKATADRPFDVLDQEEAGFDAQSGFTAATPVVAKEAGRGIDFVYAHSVDVANGAIKALQDNGLQPGKDVTVIAGNCAGDLSTVKDGSIYGAVIQPPTMEGMLAVRVAAQYLASGEVQDGEYTYPADAQEPELTTDAPYQLNYMPSATFKGADVDNLTVWGLKGSQLCS